MSTAKYTFCFVSCGSELNTFPIWLAEPVSNEIVYAVEAFELFVNVNDAPAQSGAAANEALAGPLKKPDVDVLGPSPVLPFEGFNTAAIK